MKKCSHMWLFPKFLRTDDWSSNTDFISVQSYLYSFFVLESKPQRPSRRNVIRNGALAKQTSSFPHIYYLRWVLSLNPVYICSAWKLSLLDGGGDNGDIRSFNRNFVCRLAVSQKALFFKKEEKGGEGR